MFKIIQKAVSAGLIFSSFTVFAGDIEDALIDKTVTAYGGEALLGLKTIRINDSYKSFREGQSRHPSEVDQVSYRTSTTIDFVNRRKSMQSVGGVYVQGLYVQQAFYDGNTGYRINPSAETATENPHASFARTDRGLSWRLDTALVKLLSESRADAAYKGDAVHRGKPQALLAFKAEGYPEFTLYIDKATGLLSKMTRPNGKPGSTYSYVFSDYRQQDGFTYAADTYVMRGGKPESLTATRSLEFNTNIDDAYRFPSAYGAPAKMLDDSEMSVQQLAEGVYLAGKYGGFSVFIDAGDYLVASGGYPGLAERFDAVTSFTGHEKPLKYQIVTHHHDDHIGGLNEAAELGATFIAAEEHVEAIRAVVKADLADDRFLIASKDGTYADGLVRVVDISSWHANHNLVTYIPQAKIAFSADHFFSFAETKVPDPAEMYAEFKAAVDGYGLDIERFAAAHSPRVMTYDDLVHSSTGPFKKLGCPADWHYCAE